MCSINDGLAAALDAGLFPSRGHIDSMRLSRACQVVHIATLTHFFITKLFFSDGTISKVIISVICHGAPSFLSRKHGSLYTSAV
jgi:hypothetical protein